jgi:predicted Zn finger-like uncharacterized protein
MVEPRQKTIGITPKEKTKLDSAKKLYEKQTGEKTDWGNFLLTAAIAGLAVFGIYTLLQANKNDPSVECPHCGNKFAIAYSDDLPNIVNVKCPECSEELVVKFN